MTDKWGKAGWDHRREQMDRIERREFTSNTEPEHVCGLQGYCPGPPYWDPICPACLAASGAKADLER